MTSRALYRPGAIMPPAAVSIGSVTWKTTSFGGQTTGHLGHDWQAPRTDWRWLAFAKASSASSPSSNRIVGAGFGLGLNRRNKAVKDPNICFSPCRFFVAIRLVMYITDCKKIQLSGKHWHNKLIDIDYTHGKKLGGPKAKV